MNRLREEKGIAVTVKWRLAAAYELVGQHEVAEKLVSNLSTTVKSYRELSYSYGSDFRDQAMIIETLSLLDKKQQAGTMVKELTKKMSSDKWLSTQETAYGLLALCEYAGLKDGSTALNYSYKMDASGVIEKTSTKHLAQEKFTEKDITKKAQISFKNRGKSTLFVKVIVEGIPLIGDKSSSSKDLKMTVKYYDMDGKEMKIDKLKQGKEFYAAVTLANPSDRFYKEMALTQIFPSGWEIHNNRMDEVSSTSNARYQDIRDDRIYSYYDLGPNETKTITVKLNATYQGKFYLPTVYSEAMYDHTIFAKTPGKWVEVVKEQ